MVDPFKLHLAITAAIKVNGRDRHRNEGREGIEAGTGAEAEAGRGGRARGRNRGKCNAAYTFYYQAAKFTCVK